MYEVLLLETFTNKMLLVKSIGKNSLFSIFNLFSGVCECWDRGNKKIAKWIVNVVLVKSPSLIKKSFLFVFGGMFRC